ncbi:MAG TPA: DUF3352 domain-containing protein [Candidatus Limnocylindrales bacterium]|nr:DUF3352 domain-containing protein [Candidatus Limnocylindrales bacterium]
MTEYGTPMLDDGATTTQTGGTATGRWTVAIMVVGIAIAVTILVLVILTGLGSSSIVARWVPSDTTVYGEIRFDLPGDQEANLAAFLSSFPGFDDTSRMSDKLAELADRVIGEGSDGRLDYSGQIAPWFGGQVAIASTVSGPQSGVVDVARQAELVVATVKDEAKASEWLGANVRGGSSLDHSGVTITVGDKGAAWAITEGVLLLGDRGSVTAAIDTSGESAFASRDDVATARRELGGDQLVFGFVDTATIGAAIEDAAGQMPVPVPGLGAGLVRVPAWIAAGFRVEADALVGTTVMPHVVGASTTNAESVVPTRIPASTILAVDAHDVGPRLIEAIESIGGTGELGSIDGALRLLGGADGIVGWISEVGIVLDAGPAGLTGGIVATSSDATASQSLFSQLEMAARLAGATVEEVDASGTTIISIELSGLDRLLDGVGLGDPGVGLLPDPLEGPIALSWAVQGDLVVIGASAGFVLAVLSTTDDTSLASTDAFKSMVDQAGRRHAALGWLDIEGAIDLAGSSSMLGEKYSTDIAPYLAPLDAVLGTLVVGGSVDRITVVATVSETQ